MLNTVLKTINKYNLIEKGERIIVGLSGGPDSVCLLYILNNFLKEYELKIFAVHINHMIRGEESDLEQKYVRELCEKLEIELFIERIDILKVSKEQKISIEEAGRNIRYLEFSKYAKKTFSNKIAVAHNKNDQAETVLFNIIRGTGLDGLKGIQYKNNMVIRPLLDIDRNQIEEFCSLNLLNPRIDSSNLKKTYTRNKIRLDLIPYINKNFGANIVESLNRMSSLIKEDYKLIETIIKEAFKNCLIKIQENEIIIDIKKINNNENAVKKRILRKAILNLKGNLTGIEIIHIEKIINLCENGKTGSTLYLPNKIRVNKNYDELIFFYDLEKLDPVKINQRLIFFGITDIDNTGISIETSIIKNNNIFSEKSFFSNNSMIQFFDYDKVCGNIIVRNRKEGDVFKPLNSNGTKKLKKYLIDNKIKRDTRDKILLIAKENEIIWLVGYKISDKYKVTENTKYVLKITYKE